MALSWRILLSVLNDVGRVYEGRTRYVRLFKALRTVEQLYRKSERNEEGDEAVVESATHQKAAELLASICSQNGAMWIKVAQYLSCRPDLMPEEYVTTFSRLQAQTESLHYQGFSEVSDVLINSWGEGWEQYFIAFNLIPIAVGSIAQVYKATLRNPEKFGVLSDVVAVKVRVPGVDELYEQDAIVLRALAKCLDPFFREFQVVSIVDEIIEATTSELNFLLEKSSMHEYSKLKKKTLIRTPSVADFLSSESVLVTAWIEAQPLQIILRDEMQAALINQTIETMTLAIIEDIFLHGLYHGDPHPGNILVGSDLFLIDFGLVGRLSPEQRGHYFCLMLGFMGVGPKPDFPRLFENAGFTATDRNIFVDIGRLIDDLQTEDDMDVRDRLQTIFNSLRKNKVVLPKGFVGIVRVVLLLSGLFQSRSLDFSAVFSRISL